MPKKLDPKVTEEVMLKAGLKPLVPYKNVNTKWKCECLSCGKIVRPIYTNISIGKGGCTDCGRKKSALKNTTAQSVAVNIMIKAGLKPLEPYKNNATRWKCLHKECGNIIYVLYGSVKRGQGICPICDKKRKIKKLLTPEDKAVKVMLEAGLQPLEPYKGAHANWKSIHIKCGRITKPRFIDINRSDSKKGLGCNYCGRKEVARKLGKDEKEAIAVMMLSNLQPLVPYKNAITKWKCKCLKCGTIVFPKYGTIQNRGGGCSTCAVIGITLTEPAYFYVIKHDQLGALKVGIGNLSSNPDRIKSYKKVGWVLLRKYDFPTGLKAARLETKVLRWIRKDLALNSYLTKEIMSPRGGHTETADLNEIDLSILYQKIEEFIGKGLRR